MEASRLRDYLKAKESDANKPWNKPGWPGPKKSDDESLRELEHIKKSIETLQKKIRAHSMQDLRTLRTPEEFAREAKASQEQKSPRYSQDAEYHSRKRPASADQLLTIETRECRRRTVIKSSPRHSDALHQQFQKEFHLTQFTRTEDFSCEFESQN
ncbi:hypothetical protein ANCDUO_04645 [Ancylostoma duodenale]|uniref:Uncharacterized protein n=1 Tax=Ancylostoma duodenale TaxID=51022 RepID=A0A0C2GUE8_9BILA|nr:hypothetical protein ANCDUO_04645 [Ancylostoma duodenale]